MIVLDASLLIAFLSSADAHHDAAVALLKHHVEEELGTPALTMAETLVGPATHGRAEEVAQALASMGVATLEGMDPLQLARTRAASGLRMPDAVVLHVAATRQASLATFDERLAKAAAAAGVRRVTALET